MSTDVIPRFRSLTLDCGSGYPGADVSLELLLHGSHFKAHLGQDKIIAGLARATWPCREQIRTNGTLVRIIPCHLEAQ